jgi:hypothetical protein
MQPQQPYNPTPNYDFIMSPAPPPKKSLVPLPTNSSLLQRIAIAGGGLIILIIIIIVFASLLKGGGNNSALVSIAQQQNELIRIATLGTQQATDQSAKNFAQSTELSLTTEQQQLLTYLKTNGTKVSTKQLGLTKNAKTDTTLSAAQAASTFDSTFEQVMQSQLTSYAQSLKTTFGNTTGPKARQLLSNDYSAANLMLQQLPGFSQ